VKTERIHAVRAAVPSHRPVSAHRAGPSWDLAHAIFTVVRVVNLGAMCVTRMQRCLKECGQRLRVWLPLSRSVGRCLSLASLGSILYDAWCVQARPIAGSAGDRRFGYILFWRPHTAAFASRFPACTLRISCVEAVAGAARFRRHAFFHFR